MYSADLRKHYDLANPDWRYDVVPEILDGHNIADFIDPDIDAKLAELEREEEEAERLHQEQVCTCTCGHFLLSKLALYRCFCCMMLQTTTTTTTCLSRSLPQMAGVMDTDELTEEQAADLAAIRARKKQVVAAHRLKKSTAGNRSVLPAKHGTRGQLVITAMRSSLGALGIDTSAAEARARERSQSRGRKRGRSEGADEAMADAAEELPAKKRVHSSKSRSMSRGRALSLASPSSRSGLRDATQGNKAIKLADKAQRRMNKMAKVGEADRTIPTKMPKHLFSGKRPKGKTDRCDLMLMLMLPGCCLPG